MKHCFFQLMMGLMFITGGHEYCRAQAKVEPIPYGDMDQWIDRQIKESGIIGGETKHVYAIGPTTTITGSEAYKNMGGSLKQIRLFFRNVVAMDIVRVWILVWRVSKSLGLLTLRCWLLVPCFWVRCTSQLVGQRIRRKC